jgi:hypothetical protein
MHTDRAPRSRKLLIRRLSLLCAVAILATFFCCARTAAQSQPAKRTGTQIETGFRLLYELEFTHARAEFTGWQRAHPQDPLGHAAEAASYLFEEFSKQGVLTSDFFLDDKRLLGGIEGKPDRELGNAFFAANQRAQELARERLKADAQDSDALFVLTITTGMHADYTSLIAKHQWESLRLVREAEGYAKTLLARSPDAADAYVALGATNYIVGCLPGYKRFFLRFGGISGDRQAGMQQIEIAATRGHYLRPYARTLLALASLREKQPERARMLFQGLAAEFPANTLFAHELEKIRQQSPTISRAP